MGAIKDIMLTRLSCCSFVEYCRIITERWLEYWLVGGTV